MRIEEVDALNDEWTVPNSDLPAAEAWETIRNLLDTIYDYRDALVDLLDSLERGDGYQRRERMDRAGKLLGFARYGAHIDGEVSS